MVDIGVEAVRMPGVRACARDDVQRYHAGAGGIRGVSLRGGLMPGRAASVASDVPGQRLDGQVFVSRPADAGSLIVGAAAMTLPSRYRG
ncbi:hypothetical protein [Burkholderia sp. BCC0322]|uniref:hypothetical protein n=1 Tax=unclassified Burkholderia TaxID=2613784 RepID=UPI00158840B4|nr:hypothetical protein [Burkholderia sp. BCC0322]